MENVHLSLYFFLNDSLKNCFQLILMKIIA